MKNIYFY